MGYNSTLYHTALAVNKKSPWDIFVTFFAADVTSDVVSCDVSV